MKIGNDTIIKDVNLHIHCGQLTTIIGKNGAGKTTLMKALLNEIRHEGYIELILNTLCFLFFFAIEGTNITFMGFTVQNFSEIIPAIQKIKIVLFFFYFILLKSLFMK